MKINKLHKQRVEERGYIYIGTYERYEYTIDKNICNKSSTYIRVKCNYCENIYDITTYGLIHRGHNCTHCCNKYENSFAYYIQQELKESLNKYWDWNKNTVNPYLIYKNRISKNKNNEDFMVWIKCGKKDYHSSYKISCNNFVNGNRCPYCSSSSAKVHPKDSFAQYHIDNTDPNFLEKYWSDKNTLNPWELSVCSTKEILMICQEKDYHDAYITTCAYFTSGRRCPQCTKRNGNIHPKDSFGSLYPEKAKHWGSKNKKTPYEVTPFSNKKYWFICEKCGEEFERTLNNLNQSEFGVKCCVCGKSKGEEKIKHELNKMNLYGQYTEQKEFEGLVGLRGGNLSYDFYLPKYNLLIEYQGEFHDGTAQLQTDKEFKMQQEHDRRKRKYADNHNIKLLEIWYWDYDNIEKILDREL